MTVKKVPQKFVASDGCEFESEKDAEQHEKLIKAKREYDDSFKVFAAMLSETKRTADGVPFRLGYRRYYAIVNRFGGGLPVYRTVEFSPAMWQEFEIEDENQVYLVMREHNGSRERYTVSQLYASEYEVKKALLAARDERLKELSEENEQLRNDVYPPN